MFIVVSSFMRLDYLISFVRLKFPVIISYSHQIQCESVYNQDLFSFQPTNSVYKFLSGVCVTPNTPFLLPSTLTYHQESSTTPISTTTAHTKIPRSNGESDLCNTSSGNDTQIVSEAYRFMHYAMGIYGWPMYLRQNTGMATCRLCSSLRLV